MIAVLSLIFLLYEILQQHSRTNSENLCRKNKDSYRYGQVRKIAIVYSKYFIKALAPGIVPCYNISNPKRKMW